MASKELTRARQLFETMFAGISTHGEALTTEDMRRAYDNMCATFDVPAGARISEIQIAGVPCVRVRVGPAEPERTIVFLHSGGYVIGSGNGYRSFGAYLAAAADANVLLVDYRRAPEAPFPAALDDAVAVCRAVIGEGACGSAGVVLAGDSAGGGLVLGTLIALRDEGSDLPACAVCISPWTDLANTGKSVEFNAPFDPAVQRPMLEMCASMYLAGRDPRTPLASPLYADLSGLPPLLILVGSCESLLDDARRVAEKAELAGVDVTLRVGEGMIHIWPIFVTFLPEAASALSEIGNFVQEHTKTR